MRQSVSSALEIDQHEEAIKQIDQELEAKDQLDSKQDEAINQPGRQIKSKEKLDSQQGIKIQYLLNQSKSNQLKITVQNNEIKKLTVQFSLLSEKFSGLDTDFKQHQNDGTSQIFRLRKSPRNQRFYILSLILISAYLIGKISAIF